MLEGAVMEYAKWFIGMISVMFITVAVVFMFRLNEVNSFQQEANYQIERHGGLTQEAKIALNDKAKMAYGGCIVDGPDDGAECLLESDRNDPSVKSSGFFIREYKTEDGSSVYFDRGDEQARYGTAIHYVLTRQIGSINGSSFFKPAVTGTSSSRVRGTAGE
ncbi:hypothetical protein [Metabacillus sp. SLBN-84]